MTELSVEVVIVRNLRLFAHPQQFGFLLKYVGVECDPFLLQVERSLDLNISLAELFQLLLIGQFLSDPSSRGTASLFGTKELGEFEWL